MGAYVAATHENDVDGLAITVVLPTGLAQNDLILIQLSVHGGSGTSISTPAGYTLIRRDDSGTDISQALYRKIAGASETNPQFNLGTSGWAAAIAAAIRGADYNASSPIDDSDGQANASATAVTAPAVTSVYEDQLLIGCFCILSGTTFTAPTGMTKQNYWNLNPSHTSGGCMCSRPLGQELEVGSVVATAAAAAVNIGQALVILNARNVLTLAEDLVIDNNPTEELALT